MANQFNFPDIRPTDYIDESLPKILDRDDANRKGFPCTGSFPSPVTEADIGWEVYRTDTKRTYRLMRVNPDPFWQLTNNEEGTPVTAEEVNANYQRKDIALTSLSALPGTINTFPYFAGEAKNFNSSTITTLGRQILACSTSAEVRTILGLGALSLLNTLNGALIDNGTVQKTKLAFDIDAAAGWETGQVRMTYRTQPPAGWIRMNDGSIGNVTSGATTRANADCEALFKLMWTYSFLEIQSPTGGVTERVDATSDWINSKRIVIPKVLGRVLAGAGLGSGLTNRVIGQLTGEEVHKLILNELPVFSKSLNHNHQQAMRIANGTNIYGYLVSTNPTNTHITWTSQSPVTSTASLSVAFGNDVPHNTMQPTSFVNFDMKL